MSPIFLKTFSVTFIAEWGDRSQVQLHLFERALAIDMITLQIATIALAAVKNVLGVTVTLSPAFNWLAVERDQLLTNYCSLSLSRAI